MGGAGVLTLTGVMSCQLAPVLAVSGSLTPSSTVEALLMPFLHAISSSRGIPHSVTASIPFPRET